MNVQRFFIEAFQERNAFINLLKIREPDPNTSRFKKIVDTSAAVFTHLAFFIDCFSKLAYLISHREGVHSIKQVRAVLLQRKVEIFKKEVIHKLDPFALRQDLVIKIDNTFAPLLKNLSLLGKQSVEELVENDPSYEKTTCEKNYGSFLRELENASLSASDFLPNFRENLLSHWKEQLKNCEKRLKKKISASLSSSKNELEPTVMLSKYMEQLKSQLSGPLTFGDFWDFGCWLETYIIKEKSPLERAVDALKKEDVFKRTYALSQSSPVEQEQTVAIAEANLLQFKKEMCKEPIESPTGYLQLVKKITLFAIKFFIISYQYLSVQWHRAKNYGTFDSFDAAKLDLLRCRLEKQQRKLGENWDPYEQNPLIRQHLRALFDLIFSDMHHLSRNIPNSEEAFKSYLKDVEKIDLDSPKIRAKLAEQIKNDIQFDLEDGRKALRDQIKTFEKVETLFSPSDDYLGGFCILLDRFLSEMNEEMKKKELDIRQAEICLRGIKKFINDAGASQLGVILSLPQEIVLITQHRTTFISFIQKEREVWIAKVQEHVKKTTEKFEPIDEKEKQDLEKLLSKELLSFDGFISRTEGAERVKNIQSIYEEYLTFIGSLSSKFTELSSAWEADQETEEKVLSRAKLASVLEQKRAEQAKIDEREMLAQVTIASANELKQAEEAKACERKKADELAAKKNLQRITVPMSGHCLFAALRRRLAWEEGDKELSLPEKLDDEGKKYSEQIYTYMEEHTEAFEESIRGTLRGEIFDDVPWEETDWQKIEKRLIGVAAPIRNKIQQLWGAHLPKEKLEEAIDDFFKDPSDQGAIKMYISAMRNRAEGNASYGSAPELLAAASLEKRVIYVFKTDSPEAPVTVFPLNTSEEETMTHVFDSKTDLAVVYLQKVSHYDALVGTE